MEVPMQKWPYADFAYLNIDHFQFTPKKNARSQKREYLTLEAVFVPASEAVMFFDHYAKVYRRQRSELDAYLEKLVADGWKLTFVGNMFDGKTYQFRRYQFRRVIE